LKLTAHHIQYNSPGDVVNGILYALMDRDKLGFFDCGDAWKFFKFGRYLVNYIFSSLLSQKYKIVRLFSQGIPGEFLWSRIFIIWDKSAKYPR
jgi:hypothetical protein